MHEKRKKRKNKINVFLFVFLSFLYGPVEPLGHFLMIENKTFVLVSVLFCFALSVTEMLPYLEVQVTILNLPHPYVPFTLISNVLFLYDIMQWCSGSVVKTSQAALTITENSRRSHCPTRA